MIKNESIEIEELVPGKKEKNLEDIFGEIEEIIGKLEDPDASIEDAFKEYENGMKLLKECNDKLDTIEKKVLEIGPDGDTHEF